MQDIKTPTLGESVSEATVGKWYKSAGDSVEKDELLVELETDKVTLEVNSPDNGVLEEILAEEGDTVEVDDVLGKIKEGAGTPKKSDSKNSSSDKKEEKEDSAAASNDNSNGGSKGIDESGPAARKLAAEKGVDTSDIKGSGKDGRITKGDVMNAPSGSAKPASSAPQSNEEREVRVKMTKLRQTIAKRLKESQDTAAILTTFNEVDMTNSMKLRKEYNDLFQQQYGIKLGFMSLFTKAAVQALKELPAVNAEISGPEIIYKNYYDIGIAVGTEQGLVVPVIRDCDQKHFSDIEKDIGAKAKAARDGKLSMADLTGGTFTITNGGIYGSMLSTPIINPPQSGILGLHNITKRAVVMPDGSIQARDMMYIALSYDHRIIDGREAVTFLVRVKQLIEDPRRLVLGV